MNLPLRVRQIPPPRELIDVSRTLDVSRNGLLFRTNQPYDLRSVVWVMMPYNPDAIVPDPEFPATVVRLDRKPDGFTEVAVQFHNARSDQFVAPATSAPPPRVKKSDRRYRSRVRMTLPIRVRDGNAAEESTTLDVSRAGVLFQTAKPYPVGQTVWVTMPYQPDSRQDEVPARVVRVVERGDQRGVALHFTSTKQSYTYGGF